MQVTLRKHKDFVKVSKSGLYYRTRDFIVQSDINNLDYFRVGFTASKKVGNAVVRNRCKRRMRAAAKKILPEIGISGTDYVFIARKLLISATWSTLLDSFKSAILYINQKINKKNLKKK